MRVLKIALSGLLVSATLLLTACGGGSLDVGVNGVLVGTNGSISANLQVPVFFEEVDDFDVIMLANNRQVPGVQVFPGEAQTVYLPIGQTFLLDSSGPVVWSMLVAGSPIAGSGNTITYNGATVTETLRTNLQIGGGTFASTLLPAQVPITYVATSIYHPDQVARIHIVLTN